MLKVRKQRLGPRELQDQVLRSYTTSFKWRVEFRDWYKRDIGACLCSKVWGINLALHHDNVWGL